MEKNEKLINQIKNIMEYLDNSGKLQILNQTHLPLLSQIISNFELEENSEEKNPELILVAAPTGAGKDTLVRKLTSQNKDKNFVVLNMDMFRHYYSEISPDKIELNDDEFAKKTNEISYEIYLLVEELILKYYSQTNIILTGTIKDTYWIESVLRKYKFHNYKVTLAALAVPYQESAISIFERYLYTVDTQLDSKCPDNIPIRFTKMKYHDESFEGFLKSFNSFEKNFQNNPGELIDKILVYKRDRSITDLSEDTLLYSSEQPSASTAAQLVNSILNNKSYPIASSRILDLLKIISTHSNYLKSQNVYEELIDSLKEINTTFQKPNEETKSNSLDDNYFNLL